MVRRYSQELPAERRKAARHAIEIPIELKAGSDTTIHVTSDLSAGGAFFRDAVPYPVGLRAQIRFQLPGVARRFECVGEIVNVPKKKFGMGVKFLDLTDEDADRIDRFAQNAAPTDPGRKSK